MELKRAGLRAVHDYTSEYRTAAVGARKDRFWDRLPVPAGLQQEPDAPLGLRTLRRYRIDHLYRLGVTPTNSRKRRAQWL
jgi:hypothetical protein